MATINASMNVFIHAGFPKSGTTTLQQFVLPSVPDALYIGRPYQEKKSVGYVPDRRIADLADDLADAVNALLNCEAFRSSAIETPIKTALSRCPRLVWSEELLAENALAPSRITNSIGRCPVLFTIRNQSDALISAYVARYRTQPWKLTQLSFEAWLDEALEAGRFDYSTAIERYTEHALTVLPSETMFQNWPSFRAKLEGFLGIRLAESLPGHANQRVTWGDAMVNRAFRLARRLKRNVTPDVKMPWARVAEGYVSRIGGKVEFRIPPRYEAAMQERYGPGNRKLEQAFELPLQALGYPF